MNKLNRKVEYALIGLKHMRAKSPGELTTAKEISSTYGCPFDVMSRVLQTLGKSGLIRSEQGAHGGYQISKDMARVSFFDLMETIMGPVAVARCLHEDADEAPCEIRGSCNIVSPVTALNRKIISLYKSISLSELLDPRQANIRAPGQIVRAAKEAAAQAPEVEQL